MLGVKKDQEHKYLLKEDDPLYCLFDRHNNVFSYFDDWILAVIEDEDRTIAQYIPKLT